MVVLQHTIIKDSEKSSAINEEQYEGVGGTAEFEMMFYDVQIVVGANCD